MRLGFGWVLCAGLGVCAAAACGSSEDSNHGAQQTQRACVPGASKRCAGPLGCEGYQVCNDEGSALEPCICGESGSSGGAAGSGDGDGGTGGRSGSVGSGGTRATGSSGGTSGSAATSGNAGTSSGGTSDVDGAGGTVGSGAASTTASGGVGSSGAGATTNGGSTGGTGDDCPEEPTVMLLVDASTSMWDNMFWDPVRDVVLGAVAELESEVRFGLATFGGVPGDTCPLDLDTVHVGLNRYDDIAEFYTAIEHPGVVRERPTAAALYAVSRSLQSIAGSGRRAILLVTDGNPDFCDSGAPECRADVTVRVLQDAAAAGIPTLVATLPDPGIDQEWLKAMANAGQGEPVSAPQETEFCADIPLATAALLDGLDPSTWPQGTYGDTMGPVAPIALSDLEDVEGMTATLVDAINDWASCE